MMGVGGGFLLVPLLFWITKGIQPSEATYLSLLVVWANAWSIFYFQIKNKISLERKLLFSFIPFTILGSIFGVLSVKMIPVMMFKVIFLSFLLWNAAKMVFEKNKTTTASTSNSPSPGLATPAFFGLLSGALSGLLGIGGGVIQVPVFLKKFNLTMKEAVAHSHRVILFTAGSALLFHTLSTPHSLSIAYYGCIPFAFFGARAGAKWSARVSNEFLKKLFGFVLVFLSLSLLSQIVEAFFAD